MTKSGSRLQFTDEQIYMILLGILVVVVIVGFAAQTYFGGGKAFTQEESFEIAKNAVLNTPTYVFDGYELVHTGTTQAGCPDCWTFVFQFRSSHAGYGDRKGLALAQVITPHTAVVAVEGGHTKSAIIDGEWDMEGEQYIDGASLPPVIGNESNGTGGAGIANPASVYCEESSGTLNIRGTESGEAGYCSFSDGRECEEWAFFRSNGTICTKPESRPREAFCSWSTNGTCMNDRGCIAVGCSGQICIAVTETYPITTCEWRDCYNASAYNLRCRCISNACQWAG